MARTVSIGAQSFADMRERNAFFVDKTAFIAEWWKSLDVATLVCRPRRFGKTLNLSMLECFFSTRYAGRGDLFEGLDVWRDASMRDEQGNWPVVSLSLGSVKPSSYGDLVFGIRRQVAMAARVCWPKGPDAVADPVTRDLVRGLFARDDESSVRASLGTLCEALARDSGRNVILLLDEYDTPMQEAWLQGFWDRASSFMREFLNSAFKANPFLARGLITGITRIARESIFSDLNNLEAVTSFSDKYATSFGFTQGEVDAAMAEFGLQDREGVREWYDGFEFGSAADIYNPWSITNYLDKRKLGPYWANTSGNLLVSSLVEKSDARFKGDFERLLAGEAVEERVERQLTFSDLDGDPAAVWGLLVASGYLKAAPMAAEGSEGDLCRLSVVNHETMIAFDRMVQRWFAPVRVPYGEFVRALLADDLDAMNDYLNDVALDTFSVFDAGTRPSGAEPERFYHGFVLGLLVDLRGRYLVRSNRESGYGRYDVMLVPSEPRKDPGIVMEFKVRNPRREGSLEDAAAAALAQIADRRYAEELLASGVPRDRVFEYGFAFEGKRVLVAGGAASPMHGSGNA